MSSVKEVKDVKIDIENSKGFVCVDFFADWCGPCKSFKPAYEEAGKMLDGVVACSSCDIMKHEEFAAKMKITTIPAIMLFKDGKIVHGPVSPPHRDTKGFVDWVKSLIEK